jgi:hypothetical protein
MADKTESSSKVEGEFTGDGEDNAVKRKAPTTGLEGGAMKRKVEHCCSKGEEETVTVAGDKTMEPEDDSNYNKIHEECKARYEALMEKLFGGGAPHVRVTKYPSCMSDDGQVADEDEELGVVVVDGISSTWWYPTKTTRKSDGEVASF